MITAADRRRYPPNFAGATNGAFDAVTVKPLANHHRIRSVFAV
jgi:hypothetical protein